MARLRQAKLGGEGISRVRHGRGYSYISPGGAVLRDGPDRNRAVALAIPPAWSDVWIAPRDNDHIQATGVDAAGRTQYMYHPAWREKMDQQKFERMLGLAKALPAARRAVARDLALDGYPRHRVLAGAFRLLDAGSVRPGADNYTDQHGSFGITTLRCSHATVHGGAVVELRFPGKSGHPWHLSIDDEALAALVSGLKTRGRGARLFAWRDDSGTWRPLAPHEINGYVRDRTHGDFTAKDFRTLAGTAAAARSLARAGDVAGDSSRRRAVAHAMREAADALGNTPAIARKSYVDPRIVEFFELGNTLDPADRRAVETQLLELLSQ